MDGFPGPPHPTERLPGPSHATPGVFTRPGVFIAQPVGGVFRSPHHRPAFSGTPRPIAGVCGTLMSPRARSPYAAQSTSRAPSPISGVFVTPQPARGVWYTPPCTAGALHPRAGVTGTPHPRAGVLCRKWAVPESSGSSYYSGRETPPPSGPLRTPSPLVTPRGPRAHSPAPGPHRTPTTGASNSGEQTRGKKLWGHQVV